MLLHDRGLHSRAYCARAKEMLAHQILFEPWANNKHNLTRTKTIERMKQEHVSMAKQMAHSSFLLDIRILEYNLMKFRQNMNDNE